MQISIRGVDPSLSARLRAESRKRGASLNQTVLALLRRALGLSPERAGDDERHGDLDAFRGVWSKAEARDFEEALRSQRTIDSDLWR